MAESATHVANTFWETCSLAIRIIAYSRDMELSFDWLEYCSHFYQVTFSDRIFAAKFGVDTLVCSYLYNSVSPSGISPLALLMTLNYLKCYPTVDAGHVEWRCSRDTYLAYVAHCLDMLHFSLHEVCLFLSPR